MPQLSWLQAEQTPNFPDTSMALSEPEGLLAAGGQLSINWLLSAYSKGIFPWYSDGEPILWWSPAPRMVLIPGKAHISRSLKKHFRSIDIEIRVNTCFSEVIKRCSKPRAKTDGTWIIEEMRDAYIDLHEAGWAHSIEVFQNQTLVGGLYGVGIDSVFYGESMFSDLTNASKYAFIALDEWAKNNQLSLIDCQLYNPYLESMGAKLISRNEFEQYLPIRETQLSFEKNQSLTTLLERAFF
ncbi:leucyl/phenylalanyl-tRNA--protein transferase [Reinekea sp.]|jgi:leucyl/phenylalanyl-tRNA--protein transferase|uniref:leucyl/phenylalanyl-tRNA--protein transferase n=1 Tax=Reinekea sp. TaxID=1970455 RepID=UPI003989386B